MVRTYKNTGGSHTCLDGRVVAFGESITTDEDLAAKFPHKFQVQEPKPKPKPKPVPPSAPKPKSKPKPKPKPKTPDMQDVTDAFAGAAAMGLAVRHDGRGWWVYDGDPEPANETPLKETEVPSFIAELVEV